MKILFYLILLIAMSQIAYAPDDFEANVANINAGRCSIAKFCGDSELECEYAGSDDICPQDYGDWSDCRENNYRKKCWPCDPDCGTCGQGVSIYAPNSLSYTIINVELSAYNGDQYHVSEENGIRTSYDFRIYKNGATQGYFGDRQCQNNRCSYTWSTRSPNILCKSTIYEAEIYRYVYNTETGYFSRTLIDNSRAGTKAITLPYVSIAGPAQITPETEDTNFRITASCNGDDGVDVREVDFYLEKLREGNYIPINSRGEECTGQPNQRPCNFLGLSAQRQNGYFIFDFNDNAFNNGHYKMRAKARAWILDFEGDVYEYYPENEDEFEFDIDKGLAGDVGVGGTYQGSKVLNIILARIKTWI